MRDRAPTSPAGYRQVEHTADLALELWAASEEELLAVGARAVIAELTEGEAIEPTVEREVTLEALDPADRLVRWLNEVIALALIDGFLLADARLALRGNDLCATLWGEASTADRIRHELESVTYHDLWLGQEDGRWRARVVIDV